MTNFLFVSLDDLNDWTSVTRGYGGKVHTPNMDRLAAQGVAFANASARFPSATGRAPAP
jgi:arylsulfatase A-like enzyme